MGLFTNLPTAMYGPFELRKDTVKKTSGKDRGEHPLSGVAATVESGEDLHRRLTATRVVLTGPFALLLKKKAGGTSFLTIEGPGFSWVEEVNRKKKEKATAFAAAVRSAAAVVPATEPVAPPAPAGWYPAGDMQRYWDGAAWTDHTAPLA